MTYQQAETLILTAAWMESWNDTRGHPDEQRHAHAGAAQEAAREALAVIWRAGHAAGRAEAYGEVNGQLSL